MKNSLLFAFMVLVLNTYAQDKTNYIEFNQLTEVVGTEYIIASIENRGKAAEQVKNYLLFINTKTGETQQVDISIDFYSKRFEQIKIDTLGINLIVVSSRTIDLDGKNGIDWNDPTQIIILSTDGKSQTQLTDSKLFVRTWEVNKTTGTITITGHYDTNNNGKYDKTDKNEIGIYDLKSLKLMYKI